MDGKLSANGPKILDYLWRLEVHGLPGFKDET
jgi:hypothetical protein